MGSDLLDRHHPFCKNGEQVEANGREDNLNRPWCHQQVSNRNPHYRRPPLLTGNLLVSSKNIVRVATFELTMTLSYHSFYDVHPVAILGPLAKIADLRPTRDRHPVAQKRVPSSLEMDSLQVILPFLRLEKYSPFMRCFGLKSASPNGRSLRGWSFQGQVSGSAILWDRVRLKWV